MPGANKIKRNAEEWINRKIAANLALASNWAAKLEGYMKSKAPWKDRTGNARAGLFARAERDGNDIVIRLAHTMDYGVYLELAHGRKYAILEPTARIHARDIVESYRKLWEE